jgi:hypothetical protein
MRVTATIPVGVGPVGRPRCAPDGAGAYRRVPTDFHSPWVDWQSAVVPSRGAAQELLDLLEARGVSEREFSALGESKFEVRWR